METPSISFSLTIFAISLVSSSLLVPILRSIAFKYSILDLPNQSHKTHNTSIPYLGGFAIIIPVCLLSIVNLIYFTDSVYFQLHVLLLVIPAIFLSIVGLYDDIKNLSAKLRFYLQSVMAMTSAIYLNQIGYGVEITGISIIDLIISTVWLVGITNALNFFDNVDGGAAGITLIASISVSVLAGIGNQYLIALMSLSLAGASLGFLLWNKFPAKIYLGDSGALFIGFLLAISLLQFEPNLQVSIASPLIPVFILAVPIIDTTVAVISRLKMRNSIFSGGKDHLSHRLISLGFSRRSSVHILWSLAVLFSAIGVWLNLAENKKVLGISILGLFGMAILLVWFLRVDTKN